jgi:nicotinamide-nucleotide amidase
VNAIAALVAGLAAELTARGERLAVAESCTGGLIAVACTDLAGSSAWFERGLVTYSNAAKSALLGVPEALLAEHGAVSEASVRAMAEGLLARAPVQHTIAVSGIAGPGGGSDAKPVGTVWIAWAGQPGVAAVRHLFPGDRAAIRAAAVRVALEGLRQRIGGGA